MKGRAMTKQKDYDKVREQYETKETNRERQARRRQRLTKAAQLAGFKTIDDLASAILAGEVTITRREKEC